MPLSPRVSRRAETKARTSGYRSSRSTARPRRTTSSTFCGKGRSPVDIGSGGPGLAAADSVLWEYGGGPGSRGGGGGGGGDWSARAPSGSPRGRSGGPEDGGAAGIVSPRDTPRGLP